MLTYRFDFSEALLFLSNKQKNDIIIWQKFYIFCFFVYNYIQDAACKTMNVLRISVKSRFNFFHNLVRIKVHIYFLHF